MSEQGRLKLRSSLFLFAVVTVVLGLTLPKTARAFVYWGDTDHYAVGRSAPDGQGATESFVKLNYAALPCGVAVNGPYIYWGDQLTGAIGRARIDGAGAPDLRFIVGASEPCGLAVFGNHLYWANRTINGSIGRASLSGPLHVQQNFVPSEQASGGSDLWEPCSVAVDASGIYWSDALGGGVGRANLDGTGERTLLQDSNQGCGITLGGGYLYWTNDPWLGSGMIGRALISGAAANPAYITVSGGSCGLAVFSDYLYFADGSVIDASDLDSPNPTASTEQIFMGANNACGVAVDGLYQAHLRVLSAKAAGDRAVLRVQVSHHGQLLAEQAMAGKQLVRVTRTHVHAPGGVSLVVRLTSLGKSTLRRRRTLKIRVRIVYSPTGGINSAAVRLIAFKAT